MSFGEKSIRCEKIFVSDIFSDHEEQSDNQSRQKSEMSGMWKSQKSEKWQKWIRSCLLASLHHLIPGLTRKNGEKWEQRPWSHIKTSLYLFGQSPELFAAHLLLPSRISQLSFFSSYRILHTILYPFNMSFIKTC